MSTTSEEILWEWRDEVRSLLREIAANTTPAPKPEPAPLNIPHGDKVEFVSGPLPAPEGKADGYHRVTWKSRHGEHEAWFATKERAEELAAIVEPLEAAFLAAPSAPAMDGAAEVEDAFARLLSHAAHRSNACVRHFEHPDHPQPPCACGLDAAIATLRRALSAAQGAKVPTEEIGHLCNVAQDEADECLLHAEGSTPSKAAKFRDEGHGIIRSIETVRAWLSSLPSADGRGHAHDERGWEPPK